MSDKMVDDTSKCCTITCFVKKHKDSIIFWGCALILLFFHLGERSISGSEGRWGCAVREMFVSGDFWHPTVNFESYFDKPLVSYWCIALCALLNHGVVSELMLRLPSAISALAVLGALRCMARRLWNNDEVAEVCSWEFLGFYSLIYWGRLGEADMLNLAFSTLAIAWYLRYRLKTSFWGYLLFGALCAIGGHTKGMSAIAVPLLVVLCDICLCKNWKLHLNWRFFLAILLSLGLYLLPFVLSSVFNPNDTANGLALAIHENIDRFFRAFDHKEPWYMYFVHLPRLLLPMMPFWALAMVWAIRNWKQLDRGERWVLVSTIAIFIMFSLSESKRVYYILPILPFCALLSGRFLSETSLVESPGFDRFRNKQLKIFGTLSLIAGIVFTLLPVVWLLFRSQLLRIPMFQPVEPGGTLWAFIACLLIVPFSVIGVALYIFGGRVTCIGNSRTRGFYRMIFCILCLKCGFFDVVQPYVENQCRTTKKFFMETRQELDKLPRKASQLCFGTYTYIDATYYLNYSAPIKVCEREEELKHFINMTPGAVVFLQRRHFDMIRDSELKSRLTKALWRSEPVRPWDRKKNLKKKIDVFCFEEKRK